MTGAKYYTETGIDLRRRTSEQPPPPLVWMMERLDGGGGGRWTGTSLSQSSCASLSQTSRPSPSRAWEV